MSTAQETLFEKYRLLLDSPPGKWLNTAGEVCYTYMEDGLSICLYLDEADRRCINLYKIDEDGAVRNSILIREDSSKDIFDQFFNLYNKLKTKVDDERYSLLMAS